MSPRHPGCEVTHRPKPFGQMCRPWNEEAATARKVKSARGARSSFITVGGVCGRGGVHPGPGHRREAAEGERSRKRQVQGRGANGCWAGRTGALCRESSSTLPRVQQLDVACDGRCGRITFPTGSCAIWHTGLLLCLLPLRSALFPAGVGWGGGGGGRRPHTCCCPRPGRGWEALPPGQGLGD